MIGLYLLGVLVAWLFGKKRRVEAASSGRQRGSAKLTVAPTTAFSRRACPAFISIT